jgi:16S rRNA (cytosine1402-N4)-methyltransferase
MVSGDFAHRPVMTEEVVALFTEVPPGMVVDATAGGGGHAEALLGARSDLHVIAVDRDPAAVAAASRTLARFGERATVVQGAFARLGEVVRGRHGATGPEDEHPIVGVLFDLGVSSPQLDRAERGFSYRSDAALDMRMDPSQPTTAADLVNASSEAELARILREYGEERFARRIARRIVDRRPIASTAELAAVITEAIPAATRRSGPHPARRSFQALRIAVNDELGQLREGLDQALALVAPGGRVAVLSYHSLEDRITKQTFAAWATGGAHPPGLPTLETARGGVARLLTRRPLRPSAAEVARNPRAESARLRAVELLRSEP